MKKERPASRYCRRRYRRASEKFDPCFLFLFFSVFEFDQKKSNRESICNWNGKGRKFNGVAFHQPWIWFWTTISEQLNNTNKNWNDHPFSFYVISNKSVRICWVLKQKIAGIYYSLPQNAILNYCISFSWSTKK